MYIFTLTLHRSSTKLPRQHFLTEAGWHLLSPQISQHRDGFWTAGLFLLRFMSGIHWSWNHEEHEVVSGAPTLSNTLIVCCHVTVSLSQVLMPLEKVEMEKKLRVLSRSQQEQRLWSRDCHTHHVCVQNHRQQMWAPHFEGAGCPVTDVPRGPQCWIIKPNLHFVTTRRIWTLSVSSGSDDATQICEMSNTDCLLTSIWDAVARGLVQPKCWTRPRTESNPPGQPQCSQSSLLNGASQPEYSRPTTANRTVQFQQRWLTCSAPTNVWYGT